MLCWAVLGCAGLYLVDYDKNTPGQIMMIDDNDDKGDDDLLIMRRMLT